MNKITLTEASHTDNKLSFSFDHPDSLDSVFNYSSIEFEYDVNISNIPDGVIYIPYVTNLAPISWAYDVDLVVPKLEYEFKIALDSVQETLDRFYPEMGIKESGSGIKANTIVDIGENENTNTASKTAQLFSGGLDSLTTYVRHHTEPLKLISINKHKNEYNGDWELIKRQIITFADKENVKPHFIRSNLYYLTDHTHLENQFTESIYTTWWQNVQHGLSYLGACAPLSLAENIGTIYIPSTHTNNYQYPWGSHPEIDNEMSWGDTQCVHDGYKLSRQEKWQTVANFFESRGGVHVQSCGTPGNCNDCFHCARNIVGLILEGLDPEKYGYEIRDDHFGKIRENIEEGMWELDADHRFFWEDIQQHIPNDLSSADIPDGSESFFKWLLNENLKKYEPAHS